MRYLGVRRREDLRETGYRIYITDALKIISENSAKMGGGQFMSKRWADGAFETHEATDTRPVEEIIADIAGKAGITITHEHF